MSRARARGLGPGVKGFHEITGNCTLMLNNIAGIPRPQSYESETMLFLNNRGNLTCLKYILLGGGVY